MGKWGKYLKHYKKEWEQEPLLKLWLEPSNEKDVLNGKAEAYCRFCKCHLRAHHGDLVLHSKRQKHIDKVTAFNRTKQHGLENFGHHVVTNDEKNIDLRLAMFIAMHCSIKTVDHLCELMKQLGKGTKLERLRLHRTKCSKLISAVISPAFLTDLVRDIGSQPYSLIVDEATDNSSSKFLGMCVNYFSLSLNEMVTDFLGLVQVTTCTGVVLADAVKEYLDIINLPILQLHAIGVDGAPNMCGSQNSFFTHLKNYVPKLQLFKCLCHSIDKCAEYAHNALPEDVNHLLKQSHNWFAHSALRWSEYTEYYNTINNGKEPLKIPLMGETRWLSWAPVCEVVFSNWTELKGFFAMRAESDARARQNKKSPDPEKDKTPAEKLSELYNNKSVYLYIAFLRGVLREINSVNLAFQHTHADMAKLHTDLRSLLFNMAGRIVKQDAIPKTDREGVLRSAEITVLKANMLRRECQLPLDRANFGESFKQIAAAAALPPRDLDVVRNNCGRYLFTLCMQLMDRLPDNVQAVERLRFLSPRYALARNARPSFSQLPTDFAEKDADLDLLASQWANLGNLSVQDICAHPEKNADILKMEAVHFWGCVLLYSNAVGEAPFKELALFALRCLTVPVSNAIIERVFSFLAAIKTKQRNRLQLVMIEALVRIRVHMTIFKKCCRTFIPTEDMLNLFNSDMYGLQKTGSAEPGSSSTSPDTEAEDEYDLDELEECRLNLISADGSMECSVYLL